MLPEEVCSWTTHIASWQRGRGVNTPISASLWSPTGSHSRSERVALLFSPWQSSQCSKNNCRHKGARSEKLILSYQPSLILCFCANVALSALHLLLNCLRLCVYLLDTREGRNLRATRILPSHLIMGPIEASGKTRVFAHDLKVSCCY